MLKSCKTGWVEGRWRAELVSKHCRSTGDVFTQRRLDEDWRLWEVEYIFAHRDRLRLSLSPWRPWGQHLCCDLKPLFASGPVEPVFPLRRGRPPRHKPHLLLLAVDVSATFSSCGPTSLLSFCWSKPCCDDSETPCIIPLRIALLLYMISTVVFMCTIVQGVH